MCMFPGICQFLRFKHPFHTLTKTGSCAGDRLEAGRLGSKDGTACVLAEVLSGGIGKFGRLKYSGHLQRCFLVFEQLLGPVLRRDNCQSLLNSPQPFLGETDVVIHLHMRQWSCFPAGLCLCTGGDSLFSLPSHSLLAVPCRAKYNLAHGRDLESICLLFYSFQCLPAVKQVDRAVDSLELGSLNEYFFLSLPLAPGMFYVRIFNRSRQLTVHKAQSWLPFLNRLGKLPQQICSCLRSCGCQLTCLKRLPFHPLLLV